MRGLSRFLQLGQGMTLNRELTSEERTGRLLNGAAAKVRCRTCYSDHDYRNEQAPPSKKDLKKAELFNAVLSGVAPPPAAPEEPAAITEPKKSAKKPGKRAEA